MALAGTFPGNQQSKTSNQQWDSHLQPGLNSGSQCAKVGDALQFVIRELNPEMILQFREQVERLQAVDTERLEEVFFRGELLARHLEVRRGECEDRVESLFCCFHRQLF